MSDEPVDDLARRDGRTINRRLTEPKPERCPNQRCQSDSPKVRKNVSPSYPGAKFVPCIDPWHDSVKPETCPKCDSQSRLFRGTVKYSAATTGSCDSSWHKQVKPETCKECGLEHPFSMVCPYENPETEGERLRREHDAALTEWKTGGHGDRGYFKALACARALADALAASEAKVELLEGECKAAETRSGMDNVIAQFESQLKVEREENASLLKRAELLEDKWKQMEAYGFDSPKAVFDRIAALEKRAEAVERERCEHDYPSGRKP